MWHNQKIIVALAGRSWSTVKINCFQRNCGGSGASVNFQKANPVPETKRRSRQFSSFRVLDASSTSRVDYTGSSHKDRRTDEGGPKSKDESSTLRPGEVEKFEQMSSSWWDSNGPLQELRSMNRLRVPLIRDGLLQSRQRILDMTESPKPLEKFTLIDVGCGGGVLTEPLGRLGATVIGLDPGQENITMAESHLPESLKVNVSYVCSTLEDFAKSNPGKEVDGIIMSEVIEHIDKPETVIEVASKLTKVGGSIFITTENRTLESWAGMIVAWEYLLRRLPVGTHDWNKFITPAEMQVMLTRNGFRPKLIHGMCYNPLLNVWSWTNSTAIGYCIHAIKQQD